jgi:hypothetical protein
MAAWKMMCRAKNKGGLGVIRLCLQNDALLIKNLDKFFSKGDLPWVKLLCSQYYTNDKVPGNVMKLFLVEKHLETIGQLQRHC